MDTTELTIWVLMYFVLPVWLAAGFADYLCHRASNIATTSGDADGAMVLCARRGSAAPGWDRNRSISAATLPRQPRRAASMVATSIFFIGIIAANARCASAPPAAIASVSTRGEICQ